MRCCAPVCSRLSAPVSATCSANSLKLDNKTARFEQRFGCSLAQLEATGLPTDATPADHDAYLDWVYWQAVVDEKAELLAALSA